MAETRREQEQREERRSAMKDWLTQQSGPKYEPTAVVLPEGVEWYNLQVEEYPSKIDIIPFRCGFGNPRGDKGFKHWERTYGIHRVQTPNGRTSVYCCLFDTWKRPCPICYYRESNRATARKEFINSLYPRGHRLFVVNDKPGDIKNKLKMFDTLNVNRKMGFGELFAVALRTIIDDMEENDTVANLRNGWTLKLTVEKMSGGEWNNNRDYNAVTRIDFERRKYDYDKSIMQHGICPDDCLIPARPAELKKKPLEEYGDDDWKACYDTLDGIFQVNPQEIANARKAQSQGVDSKNGKTSPADDDDDDDDDDDAPPQRTVAKQAAPVDDDDDDDTPPAKSAAANDDSDLVDDDDDEAPVAQKKAAPVDDDDDDDTPPAKSAAKAPAGKKYAINDMVMFNNKLCEIIGTADGKKGRTYTLEDAKGKEYDGITEDQIKPQESGGETDDDDDTPKSAKPAASGGAKSRSDDDDDDGFEDDTPRRPAAAKSSNGKKLAAAPAKSKSKKK